MAEGIRKHHSRGCPAREGRPCRCGSGYEAFVFSPRDGKRISKTFRRESEARSWRAAAKREVDEGTLRSPSLRTLREVATLWLGGAERGEIRNRSGRPFKPATLRGYRQALSDRILPVLGSRRVSSVTTSDLQEMVDSWQREGLSSSTIRNAIKPLQAIYRRARSREGLPVNPTRDLELPVPEPGEVEIVSPAVAAKLISAVDEEDRVIWATALYAGLRYGELRALRWGAVDVKARTIAVRESWDPKTGAMEPKTRRSRRKVPMPAVLRALLAKHRLRRGNPAADDLVFAVDGKVPFQAEKLYRVADQAWRGTGIAERLRLHQARHTYASFMIAAGVNPKALSSFMGHASITVTFDLYGHLMPGTESEGAALLDAFLEDPEAGDAAA